MSEVVDGYFLSLFVGVLEDLLDLVLHHNIIRAQSKVIPHHYLQHIKLLYKLLASSLDVVHHVNGHPFVIYLSKPDYQPQ